MLDPFPFLPPTPLIFAASLAFFQLLDLFLGRWVSTLPLYSALPTSSKYAITRRLSNLIFNLLQLPLNVYLLVTPTLHHDILYAYNPTAHIAFIIILAFYIHDAAGLVLHPGNPANRAMWLAHHYIAAGLLLYNVVYKHSSAYPAATFLISAAGHVPNEVMILLRVCNVRSITAFNAVRIIAAIVTTLTLGFPPPILLWKSANQLQLSLWQLITTRMRPYCILFFSLFYFPHVYIIIHITHRAIQTWNTLPPPLDAKKIN